MKINGSTPIAPVLGVAQSQRGAEQPGTSGGKPDSDQVHLSSDARWISELRAQARQDPGVRPERVAEVQAQLADGSFEQSVDMDAVLEGLLAEL